MELREFQGHIRTLASLPETRAPVVSCYLRVEGGRLRHRRVFTRRIEEKFCRRGCATVRGSSRAD